MLKKKKNLILCFFFLGFFNIWFVGENTKNENIEEK